MMAQTRAVLFTTVLCCATLLSTRVLADPAETMLQDGVVNFRVGKFAESIKVLKKARRKARDPKIKAKIHLYLGMNFAVKKKQRKKARKSFTRALKLDPTLTLASGDAKKSIIALFEEVRQGMTGTLEVESTPAGALVQIGDQSVGKTPYRGKLHVGRHSVLLLSEDKLERYEAELVVEQGKSYSIQGKLKFVGGKLTVATRPDKARVLLDGKEIGVTPLKDARVAAGDHELRLELNGHEAQTRKFKLARGGSVALELTLKPPPPRVPVKPPVAQPVPPSEKPLVVVPKPEVEKPSRGRSVPVWTIVAGGLALAAAGAGIGFVVASDSAYEEFSDMANPPSAKRWDELKDEIPKLDTGATVSFAVAGGLAVTAALLYFLVDRPAMQEGKKTAVSVGPGGFAFTWQF